MDDSSTHSPPPAPAPEGLSWQAGGSEPQLLSLASFVVGIRNLECSKAMEGLLAKGWTPRPEALGDSVPSGKGAASSNGQDDTEGIFPLTEEGWTLKVVDPDAFIARAPFRV